MLGRCRPRRLGGCRWRAGGSELRRSLASRSPAHGRSGPAASTGEGTMRRGNRGGGRAALAEGPIPRASAASGRLPIRSSETGKEIVLTVGSIDPAHDPHEALPTEHLGSGFLGHPEEPPVFRNLAPMGTPGLELAIDIIPHVDPGGDVLVGDTGRRATGELLPGDLTGFEERLPDGQSSRLGKRNPEQLAGCPQTFSL